MWWWLLVWTVARVSAASEPGHGQPWWSDAVYYRIIVDSFKDSDGDGLGDLNGLLKQLSYPRALGADAVILSPISSKSPDCKHPGVVDLAAFDPRYGTNSDFQAVLEKAKKIDLKVVITLPVRYVSTISEWFNNSADGVRGYEDFIIWKDLKGHINDGNSSQSWTTIENQTKAFASYEKEALLNLCSENVIAALAISQCAWIRRGVSGILLNPDFPPDVTCGQKVVQKLAADAARCARSASMDVPLILAESSLPLNVSSKYMSEGRVGANSLISTTLSSSKRTTTVEITSSIHSALIYAPTDSFPTWITTTTNESHAATRYGSDMVDAINLLSLTLPGACIIQQGDELGSADTILECLSAKETCWPSTPATFVAPFAWNSSSNGGFTTGEPWVPLPTNSRYANAKGQFNIEGSHFWVLKTAAAMRKSIANGPQFDIKRFGDALTVLRWGRQGSILLIVNLGQEFAEVPLKKIFGLPQEMTVATSSSGSKATAGAHVDAEKTVKLTPGEVILMAGGARQCGGPGAVDKIANKIQEGWQKINKYFN